MSAKPIFDWTINLGHVLTFVGFLLTIAVAFATLDKRITVVEQQQIYQVRRDSDQDRVISESKAEQTEALKDVHRSLEKLNDKLDTIKDTANGRH